MASIEYIVNGSGTLGTFLEKAGLQVDRLNEDLDQLSRQVATPAVDLEDKDAVLKMARIAQQIDKLSAKIADPTVKLDQPAYEKARLQILRMEAALARLDHKDVTVTVSVRQKIGSTLRSIGSAVTGEQGAFGGAGGFLSSPLGIGGITGGVLAAAGLIPGVAGLGLGAGVGLGAIAGGFIGAGQGQKIIKADQANIKAITAALKSATGKQKKELHQSLTEANKQLTKDMTFFAPFMELQGSLKNLGKIFLTSLRPIMAPLAGIFKDFGSVLKTLEPQITGLFKASLPFLKAFADVMLKSGDILIPAFTDALNQMVKSGALKIMSDSLVVLVRGLGQFIEALGPGMRASAEMFARLMTFLAKALPALGKTFSAVANFIIHFWSPSQLWDHIVGWAKTAYHVLLDAFHSFVHANAVVFDNLRHDIAHVWDTIWDNTVGRLRNGLADMIGWLMKFPGRAIGALWGLGHRLAAFMHDAFTDMWNAAKNVAGGIWHWLTDWVHRLPSWVRSLLHINSPSGVFYDIGKNMMLGLVGGIKDHANQAKDAWGGAIDVSGLTGPLGGDPAQNVAIARRMFPWPSSMWSSFFNLTMGESGFNRFIRNQSSGAYGIPQALPESKLPFAGQSAGGSHAGAQLAWMFRYISQVYRNPVNAYNTWLSRSPHWYDRGGWLMPGLTMAVNATGRPERVLGPNEGRGGGSTYNITINAPSGNGREIGRQIVTYIKQFEAGSGSGWRR